MNATTVRVLGVAATVVAVVTVGITAARAAQPPDASEIPVVLTSRPVSDAATDTLDSPFGSVDSSTATIRPQPEPAQAKDPGSNSSPGSNSGPGSSWGSGSEFGVSSPGRGGDVVVPPVRNEDEQSDEDDEKDDEEQKKKEEGDH